MHICTENINSVISFFGVLYCPVLGTFMYMYYVYYLIVIGCML